MRIYRSINIHKSYHVRDLVQVSIGGRKVRTLGMGDYVGMALRCGFIMMISIPPHWVGLIDRFSCMKIRWFEDV